MAKVRTGFVSNSSSSSFIVTLPMSIKNYSLEEFRELIKGNSAFDPVERLYDDLCNLEESQRPFSKWDKERYGIDELDYNQYLVEYGDDYSNRHYEQNIIMEHEFMPNLVGNDDIEIDVISYSNH